MDSPSNKTGAFKAALVIIFSFGKTSKKLQVLTMTTSQNGFSLKKPEMGRVKEGDGYDSDWCQLRRLSHKGLS